MVLLVALLSPQKHGEVTSPLTPQCCCNVVLLALLGCRNAGLSWQLSNTCFTATDFTSVQEMYGKHAPRQLWQLPASRLSVGGQQVAGSNGLQQPIVLLPANARQGPGHGRHQGLAVLPGSFAAQALSHTDKASPQASAPHPGCHLLPLIPVYTSSLV